MSRRAKARTSGDGTKERVSVTINAELVRWMDEKINVSGGSRSSFLSCLIAAHRRLEMLVRESEKKFAEEIAKSRVAEARGNQ